EPSVRFFAFLNNFDTPIEALVSVQEIAAPFTGVIVAEPLNAPLGKPLCSPFASVHAIVAEYFDGGVELVNASVR
ncbi:unnamed protein product, partial [marine sediment metagenome]